MNKDDYAVIEENLIVNTVLWDGVTPWSQPDGSTVMLLSDALAAGIQYAPTPPPVRRVWRSAADFWAAFTDAERLAVAGCSDPQIKMLALTLGYWDSELHSDNPTLQAGMEALVATGLITRARANELLNPPGLKE